ncbi:MAG: PIN domain-containing protein [Bdellovibrionota bacterium]
MTSELTLAEALIKPLRMGNYALAEDYKQAIQPRDAFRVVPIGREVLEEAARVRAHAGLKMPDAIHAATARLAGCSHFVSNDLRLESAGGFSCVVLPRS